MLSYLGLKKLALETTLDNEHKFDLALQLDDIPTATSLASALASPEADSKWKSIGDRALALWKFDLARECFEKANDLSALMLLLLASGDAQGLEKLASDAGQSLILDLRSRGRRLMALVVAKGQNNLAFAALLQLNDPTKCVDLLLKTNRPSEAAVFARTYAPK